MLGIGANNSHHSTPLDNLALFATSLDGWFHFHLALASYLPLTLPVTLSQASKDLGVTVGDGESMLKMS
jgi:hypothetical protein